MSLFSHLSMIVSSGLIFYVISQLFKIQDQLKQKATISLISTLISLEIWIIITHIILYFNDINGDMIIIDVLGLIANVIVFIGLIFLVIFVHLHLNSQIFSLRLFSLGILIGLLIGIRIGKIVASYNRYWSLEEIFDVLTYSLNAIIILISIFFISSDFIDLLKENITENQRSQIKVLAAGILIVLTGMIPVNILVIFFGLEIISIGYLLIALSMVTTSYAYKKDPRISFIIPYRTNLLLLVNSAGNLKYAQTFSSLNTSQAESDKHLLSSALTAIRTIISDFFETDIFPQSLTLDDQIIKFKFDKDYFIAVFSKYERDLINDALERSVVEINKKYEDKITEIMQNGLLLDLNDIISETFYFAFVNTESIDLI